MHADIQAPLSGPETIWVCELPLTLRPGEFAVFFPWIDAHMPCCSLDGATSVKKLVIKVRAR